MQQQKSMNRLNDLLSREFVTYMAQITEQLLMDDMTLDYFAEGRESRTSREDAAFADGIGELKLKPRAEAADCEVRRRRDAWAAELEKRFDIQVVDWIDTQIGTEKQAVVLRLQPPGEPAIAIAAFRGSKDIKDYLVTSMNHLLTPLPTPTIPLPPTSEPEEEIDALFSSMDPKYATMTAAGIAVGVVSTTVATGAALMAMTGSSDSTTSTPTIACDTPACTTGLWNAYAGLGKREQTKHTPRERVRRALEDMVEADPDIRICITGHSVGGCLASLCAYDLATSSPLVAARRSTLISFASPRFFNAPFQIAMKQLQHVQRIRALRVNVNDDIIPQWPALILGLLPGVTGRVVLHPTCGDQESPVKYHVGDVDYGPEEEEAWDVRTTNFDSHTCYALYLSSETTETRQSTLPPDGECFWPSIPETATPPSSPGVRKTNPPPFEACADFLGTASSDPAAAAVIARIEVKACKGNRIQLQLNFKPKSAIVSRPGGAAPPLSDQLSGLEWGFLPASMAFQLSPAAVAFMPESCISPRKSKPRATAMSFIERNMRRNAVFPAECNNPECIWIINIVFRVREKALSMSSVQDDCMKMLTPYLRFCSIAREDGTWEPTSIDMAYHFVQEEDMGDASSAVEDAIGRLMMQTFDLSHPLWRVHVVPGQKHGAAVVLRIHHCICDGLCCVRVLRELSFKARAEQKQREKLRSREHRRSKERLPVPLAKDNASALLKAAVPRSLLSTFSTAGISQQISRGVSLINKSLNLASDVLASAKNTIKIGFDGLDDEVPKLTRTESAYGSTRRAILVPPHSLQFVKDIKKAFTELFETPVALTEVVLAVFASALRRFIEVRTPGFALKDKMVRVSIPVPLPTGVNETLGNGEPNPDALYNSFVPVSVPMAIAETDVLRTLQVTHEILAEVNIPVMAGVLNYMNDTLINNDPFPQSIRHNLTQSFMRQHTVGFSNVPGPQEHGCIGDGDIQSIYVMLPTPNFQVTLLSYDGTIAMAVVVDPDVVDEPNILRDLYIEELVELGKALGVHGEHMC